MPKCEPLAILKPKYFCVNLIDIILRKSNNGVEHGTCYKFYFLRYIRFFVIKSRRLRWEGHLARMEDGRSALKILTGKPRGKGPLGRSTRRWEDNIRMDLKGMRISYKELD